MIAQERIVSPTSSQLKLVAAPPTQTAQNDNWYHYGTEDAWYYTDYQKAPYNICTEASTTAYKLPQYEEDMECYRSLTPLKTSSQIWQEVEEFKASASSDDPDEF